MEEEVRRPFERFSLIFRLQDDKKHFHHKQMGMFTSEQTLPNQHMHIQRWLDIMYVTSRGRSFIIYRQGCCMHRRQRGAAYKGWL